MSVARQVGAMTDENALLERATVTRYEPPAFGLAEPVWVAEDPETNCLGIGHVEREAVGNLVSVVCYEGGRDRLKLPGQVTDRLADDEPGLLDRLTGWL